MKALIIREVANGFVVDEDAGMQTGLVCAKERRWVFERPSDLATFINNWGVQCEAARDEAEQKQSGEGSE